MSCSFDLSVYLTQRFPGLKTLQDGLFYRWPIGLRFELGGRGTDPDVRAMVQHRAVTLYEATFPPEDVCVVVSAHWLNEEPDPDIRMFAPLFEFSRQYSVGLCEPQQELREVYVPKEFNDPEGTRIIEWTVQSARSFQYPKVLQGIANADYAIEPTFYSKVFFVNPQTDLILHMYDDRGLDVIAPSRAPLESLYREFNSWILNYDRECIDRVFLS